MFIIHLKHAASCDDSGSSYIYNTIPPMALAVHHNKYILNTLLMWRFRFIIYLKHAPTPMGETGSSYILNTPLVTY